ncbi:type II secretion system protein [Lentisphaera profundi]|uniref:Type II secretion system protein n=1 Tax=Lentisphaera profundi TaxID=1658616 RepID=A0ABY7VMW5_9BACT|nr:type II secretion system protein [Lentisphaera profundi]WDE95391.1 type II secretion system protein [Lentisphaera profundi]
MKKFTLIELLVVIAIIGILASLLLPVLGKARQAAQKTVCVNNMKQLSVAMYIYSDDNDNKVITAAVSGSITYSKQLSEDYGMNDRVFACALDDVVRNNDRATRSYSLNTGSSSTFTGADTPETDADCDGPSRMAAYNNIGYNEIASDTLLLTELWENINYAHGWARADMTWAYWSYLSNWTDRINDLHDGRPNYLLLDGSVGSRVHTSYVQAMFTRDGED